MNLLELLKELKNQIRPDKDYVLKSKSQILEKLKEPDFILQKSLPQINIWKLIYSFGFSVVILVILFFSLTLVKNLTPKFEALNPETIRAEADTIDFQINLSKIIYNMPPEQSRKILESTLSLSKEENKNEIINKINQITTSSLKEETNQTTSTLFGESITSNTSTLSVDEVLEFLSK